MIKKLTLLSCLITFSFSTELMAQKKKKDKKKTTTETPESNNHYFHNEEATKKHIKKEQWDQSQPLPKKESNGINCSSSQKRSTGPVMAPAQQRN